VFAAGIIDRVCAHPFPGNVRELHNAVERAFFSAKGVIITDFPVEACAPSAAARESDDVEKWFNEIADGKADFWSAVHNRYKRRDISRQKVVALIDFGLRTTRGSYKKLASKLRLNNREYRRLMDFLRRSDCLLDFRPYRKGVERSGEN
jgi:DNA-binding NtrC family response regulator